MAKLSELVSRAAEVTGIARATVQEVGRRLREGGLIQTGEGGRYGGADMTPDDAASLLTALLIVSVSSVSLSKIVPLTRSHLKDFRSYSSGSGEKLLLDRWDQKLALPRLCSLPRGHTFGDSLSALISSIMNGDVRRAIGDWASSRPHGVAAFFSFGVEIAGPRPHAAAEIEFNTAAFVVALTYLRPRDVKKFKLIGTSLPRKWRDASKGDFDLVAKARVTEITLGAIGNLLSEEHDHAR